MKKRGFIEQQPRLFHDDGDDLSLSSSEVALGSTRIYATVKPDMLQWGRQYAYLSIADAAQKIGVSVEKLREWEKGVSSPTVNQLHKIAHAYKQLFAVFYLPDPPLEASLPLKDFRRLPSGGLSSISHELASEIRTAISRREIAIQMVEEMGEETKEFLLAASLGDKPSTIAKKVREALFSDLLQVPSFTDKHKTFRFFRERLENLGILVFQASTVGVHEMRGFSITDSVFPVIVVNRKDSPAGRIFSLFHELTHVLLRISGLCEIDPDITLPPEEQAVEIFCNKVAAEILMPEQNFLMIAVEQLEKKQTNAFSDTIINSLSNIFGVSREAVVRRLLTLDLVTKDFYLMKRSQYQQETPNKPEKKKDNLRISPARTILSLAGKTYVSLVLGAIGQNRITLNDASGYLNVRVSQISTVGQLAGI